jgi:AbrB family looped-hinge helix DNA binding protein
MSAVRAKVDKAGRLLIPYRMRQELGLGPGESVILERREDRLEVRPYKRAVAEAQAMIRKYIPGDDVSLVDELLNERRTAVR